MVKMVVPRKSARLDGVPRYRYGVFSKERGSVLSDPTVVVSHSRQLLLRLLRRSPRRSLDGLVLLKWDEHNLLQRNPIHVL